MIESVKKVNCCGCSACVQKCPTKAITMMEGEDGFFYPILDKENCIECRLCLNVCQAITPFEPNRPLNTHIAYNKNKEERKQSSSGGIFVLLADYILRKNGVVFGAIFNEQWEVIHTYSETKEGISKMMGSKYVQSQIKESFKQAENFLKQGRLVLFSGTPCQITGLKKYLQKEHENLFCIDFVCHGVPSPGIWRRYLKEITKKINDISCSITNIEFRNKNLHSWEKFGFVISGISTNTPHIPQTLISTWHMNNSYMKGFLYDLFLRESCYRCKSKKFSSKSDFTIGDFWGFRKLGLSDFGSGEGISLLTTNTTKAIHIISKLNFLEIKEISYQQMLISNPNIERSQTKNKKRIDKFNHFSKKYDISVAVEKTLKQSCLAKVLLSIKFKLGIIK